MILRLVIGAIVIYLLFKLLRAWKSPGGERGGEPSVPGEDLVEDPFCHTYIPVSHALKTVVEGKTLYFCSQPCLDAYKNREKT